MNDKQKDMFGLNSMAEQSLKVKKQPRPKPLSRVRRRAIESSTDIVMNPPEAISYQHTVLCQTSMPYRDPGQDVIRWERTQGSVHLLINAGEALNPEIDQYVQLGLPFGPKPRLILAHLNAEALKTGSPVLDLDDSLTAFVRRIQNPAGKTKTGPNGREIRVFKDHLGRLAAATIRMAVTTGQRAVQLDSKIVSAFDLWFPKNDQQRVLWPSTIQLSLDYFNSLQKHAVPLDERALSGLSHSAMGLDLYCWLAQRLHRIPAGKPQFIPWPSVQDQFGQGYKELRFFRRTFRRTLAQVLAQYHTANIEADGRGLTLRNSSPPIAKRVFLVNKPVG